MNESIYNTGVMNYGSGSQTVSRVTIGDHAQTNINQPSPSVAPSEERPKGIGVVAIKAAEAGAVIHVFGLTQQRDTLSGQHFYTGTVKSADGPVEMVAARTLQQGPRSIIPTLEHLRQWCNPAMYIVVGIGGSISEGLDIGDVVVADRVIYYDHRREAEDGVHPRSEVRETPARVTYAVNSFFDRHGEEARLQSPAGAFRVVPGPIGSGDAVVTDERSWIRDFLRRQHEHVLAVEMEAGGLTQFCHENSAHPDWLVVRGISDRADRAKTAEHQAAAAYNAAVTLQHLLPYLPGES